MLAFNIFDCLGSAVILLEQPTVVARRGMLRLREAIRGANQFPSLRMTRLFQE